MKHTLTLVLAALLLAGGARLSAQEKPDPKPPIALPAQPPGGGIGGPGLPGLPGLGGPGGADHKELVAALIDNLDDSDAEVRQEVATALGKIGRQAVSPLVAVLKDKDKSTALRANAAYALGKVGPPAQEALPELTKALKEKDKELRKRAAYAVGNIVQGGGYGFGFGGIGGPFPGGPPPLGGGGGLKPLDPGAAPPGLLPPEKKLPDKDKN